MHSKLRANIIFNFQACMMKSGKKTAADSSAIEGIKASSETIKAITENSDAAQKPFKDMQKRQIELEMHRAEVIRLREDFQKFREKHNIWYDMSPFGYITLNDSGQILEVNQKFAEMVGFSKTELCGKNISDYLNDDSRDSFISHLNSVINSSDEQQFCILNLIRKDFSVFTVEFESIFFKDNHNFKGQCFTMVKELSAKKQMNGITSLDSKVIELSCDAIILTDKNLNIIYWNKAAERSFGWLAREAIDHMTAHLVRSKVLSFLTDKDVMKYLTERGTWYGEAVCAKKDDSKISVLASTGIMWDENGEFNGILVILHEVAQSDGSAKEAVNNRIEIAVKERTEEISKANLILQLEIEKHKQAELAARESEGKNRDLVDNIKLGIFRRTPGPRGKFLEINKAMEELTGYSRKELLQIDVCDLYTNPEDTALRSNDVTVSNWKSTRELTLRRKNGQEIIIAETILAIRYDSGKISFYDGILEDITDRKQAQLQVDQSLQQLQKTIKEIIEAMAYIGEVRDPYTAGHQRRVAQLSSAMGITMGLKDSQQEGLYMAAFVHDIGKILVPSDILSKPGKLTKYEFEMIKDHTRVGYEILKTIEFPWPIAQIVLQHHERLDGSGYPNGLKENDIIKEAKILAVADVVEAMSSHRPYRPALGIDAALDEIKKHRGKLYDPTAVDACVNLFEEKNYILN
jgi:PAS domain S-box-containing protein